MTLSSFEGLSVIRAGVEMPGAAGGLRDAMRVDPVELHHGDTGFVILPYTVRKVRFDPVDREDAKGPQERVHVLDVQVGTLVPGGNAELAALVADVQERVRIAKEEEKGIQRLPDGDGDPLGVLDGEAPEVEKPKRSRRRKPSGEG